MASSLFRYSITGGPHGPPVIYAREGRLQGLARPAFGYSKGWKTPCSDELEVMGAASRSSLARGAELLRWGLG
jgi:hypothetical protein